MGCVSSKILTKSRSFREKVNQSFQRSDMMEEIILSNSKSTGDQLLALLCTKNSVNRRTKAAPSQPEGTEQSPAKIETINVSDFLAGLEEENNVDEEQRQEAKQGQNQQETGINSAQSSSESAIGRAKSFRTVEDYDALVAESHSLEEEEEATQIATNHKACQEEEERRSVSSSMISSGAKRRAMARELTELKVPAFEFSKSGSLRDWLLRGGQIFSPGSYVTPKFGNVASSETKIGDQIGEHAVFDPELVAQFEQAMEQLSMDEEHILKEIVESLEEGEKDQENSNLEKSKEPIKVQD